MQRRVRVLVAVVVALTLAAACASGPDEPGPNDGSGSDFDIKATNHVDDRGIDPAVTTVHTGQAISVVNTGTTDHGLTSDSIDTGTLHPNESTTIFVTAAGTIDVRDRAEPTHTAKIDVQSGT